MRALDRKLYRDLWRMKGQALAIAMVVAGGVATYVLSASTLDSLRRTQARFYGEYRFADAFAALKRAPESVRERVEAIPGVQLAQTRVTAPANLDLEKYQDPISAMIVSIPDGRQPELNRLHLTSGRLPEAGREQEVLVSEAFADAHGLEPGATLAATINGRRRRLTMVGIALSPEFIYQLQPGAIIPDFKSYAILWMGRNALEAAFDMEGAFNELALRLESGAQVEEVVLRLDRILAPYGGLGAHGRKDQVSHRYLSEEFRSLGMMATIFPAIFLGVAAFLLNVVLTRLMATQRGQIAILKAFGYPNGTVVLHYLKLTAAVVLVGVAIGLAGGTWMGRGMSRMYMEFYRFPYLEYMLRPKVALMGALVSLAAAMLGTLHAVIRAAMEPPAVAMQAAPPGHYRVSLVERLGLGRRISQAARMIVRSLERHPLKAALSMLGVALSCGILVLGGFWNDAVDYMLFAQFKQAQRDDMTVTFVEPVSRRALYSLVSLPGVHYAEPYRSVPARLRFGHRSYRTAVQGLEPDGQLRRLLDTDLDRVRIPPDGVILTDYLAKILEIRPGESLIIETLEGNRAVREAPVVGLVKEYVGVAAYMDREALNRMMREGDAISGAYLAADESFWNRIFTELERMPAVAGTTVRRRLLESFYETMARQTLVFAFFNTLLAATIAIGVVYNTARISLAERSRELASLRVLGYTRGEISFILLGELAVIILAAIPAGWLIGWGLASFMTSSLQTDLFRIPLVLTPWTLAFASLVVLMAAGLSGLIVRRKLDHLDLVEVLKTKE
jgi:putative ABC transport system permease protein